MSEVIFVSFPPARPHNHLPMLTRLPFLSDLSPPMGLVRVLWTTCFYLVLIHHLVVQVLEGWQAKKAQGKPSLTWASPVALEYLELP